MFTVQERERTREHVLALAHSDPRVVAAAAVGALAEGGDRWSDLDLAFAVRSGVPVEEVLADWTQRLADELGAVHLFDLPTAFAIYRVFLLPGCLQVDLSFGPEADFGPRGPRFRLLFGRASDTPFPPEPSADELFGLGAHHAVRAFVCLERARIWQAEYWISALHDQALALACLRRGLPSRYGRGVDDLPGEVLVAARDALARSLEPDELRRALTASVETLLREGSDAAAARQAEPLLRELLAP